MSSRLIFASIVTLLLASASAHADPNGARGVRRAFLGVGTEAVVGSPGGIRVTEVLAGSPAEAAGLVQGDVIMRIGRFRAHSPGELVQVVSVATPGQPLELRVRHAAGGAEQTIRATLGEPPEEGAGQTARLIGQAAPAVSATRLAGADPVGLDALRGRVVLLDFWATWCGPCRATMPQLDALHRTHHDAGLTILGLSSERADRIRSHLARAHVGYTIANDNGTAERFGVEALPTLVVIDRAGRVREVLVGFDPNALRRLDTLVRQLLAEPVPPQP